MARSRRTGRGIGGQMLMVALGAVAGLAIGMALADRAGGRRRRQDSPRQRRRRDDGWRDGEGRSPSWDGDDDEPELAPEAISHLHLRGRAPTSARPAVPPPGAAPVEAMPGVVRQVELEERVLDVFRNDPLMADRPIDIGAVAAHTIELAGWVHEESEIAYAVTLASGVPGVKVVESLLALRPRGAG
jgi:hypothetical protein